LRQGGKSIKIWYIFGVDLTQGKVAFLIALKNFPTYRARFVKDFIEGAAERKETGRIIDP
jgi:hypothetical protein